MTDVGSVELFVAQFAEFAVPLVSLQFAVADVAREALPAAEFFRDSAGVLFGGDDAEQRCRGINAGPLGQVVFGENSDSQRLWLDAEVGRGEGRLKLHLFGIGATGGQHPFSPRDIGFRFGVGVGVERGPLEAHPPDPEIVGGGDVELDHVVFEDPLFGDQPVEPDRRRLVHGGFDRQREVVFAGEAEVVAPTHPKGDRVFESYRFGGEPIAAGSIGGDRRRRGVDRGEREAAGGGRVDANSASRDGGGRVSA